MSSLLAWLADVFVGPQCPWCLDRFRGPRTRDKHIHLQHAGDDGKR